MTDSCRSEGKRTWRRPSGEWGVTGMGTAVWREMPAPVYAALHKLMRLEHPDAPTRADRIRSMTDEKLATLVYRYSEDGSFCRMRPECEDGCPDESLCLVCALERLQEPDGGATDG